MPRLQQWLNALGGRPWLAAGVAMVAAGLFVWTFFTVVSWRQDRIWAAMAERGRQTTGIVTAAHPDQHDTVEYRYRVGQQQYTGDGGTDPPNPDAADLRPGQTLRVVYLADDPSVSCACDPADDLANDRLSAWVGGPVMGLWAGFLALMLLRHAARPVRSVRATAHRGQLHLRSVLPLAECMRRLTDTVAPESIWTWFGADPRTVWGRVMATSFRISRRPLPGGWTSSFRLYAEGMLATEGAGTALTVSIGPDPFVRWFQYIWFGIGAVAGAGVIEGAATGQTPWPVVLIPIGMLLFGWTFVRVSTRASRPDRALLLDYLQDVLEVRPDGDCRSL